MKVGATHLWRSEFGLFLHALTQSCEVLAQHNSGKTGMCSSRRARGLRQSTSACIHTAPSDPEKQHTLNGSTESKTANNPGNFAKIGKSFTVVTSLVFSLEPIFLKISDRMSLTLALITLSSYPNQNSGRNQISHHNFFKYHQDEGFS